MNSQSENHVESNPLAWELVGIIILAIRFAQGWIFWAGGSRRFIYAPYKLDPSSSTWLANKLQSTMPGALLGTGSIISFMLQHFLLLYISLIVFSLVELISGVGLLFGAFTRLFAFITILFSLILMIAFGRQGTACLDEWTVSVCTFSMGITLFLSGASSYSIDQVLLRKYPEWGSQSWFRLLGSGPWAFFNIKFVALIMLVITMIFTLGTYNYYRGAILSRYHAAPVSPTTFNIQLSEGKLYTDGAVEFMLYVDAGPQAASMYIVSIDLIRASKTLATWDNLALSKLPAENIVNVYDYNKVKTGPYGLIAPVSAKARIKLPPLMQYDQPTGMYKVSLHTVDGSSYNLTFTH